MVEADASTIEVTVARSATCGCRGPRDSRGRAGRPREPEHHFLERGLLRAEKHAAANTKNPVDEGRGRRRRRRSIRRRTSRPKHEHDVGGAVARRPSTACDLCPWCGHSRGRDPGTGRKISERRTGQAEDGVMPALRVRGPPEPAHRHHDGHDRDGTRGRVRCHAQRRWPTPPPEARTETRGT